MRPDSEASGSPWPVQTLSYGSHPEQFGQLRAPPAGSAPAPVVVLVHGGYWRSRWQLDLMDPLAAVRHLDRLAGQFPLDLARLIMVGHSAGGQLAARVAADLLADSAVVRPA